MISSFIVYQTAKHYVEFVNVLLKYSLSCDRYGYGDGFIITISNTYQV